MKKRAVLCRDWGGPETLVIGECPTRPLEPNEVRVRVRAAGLGFSDGLMIQKKYQMQPALPFSPGAEAAGEVVEVGAAVTGFLPGARVACLCIVGALAEELVVPAIACFELPDAIGFDVGAVLLASYGTAWHALHDRGAAKAGETVLVLGAAGGVGLATIQVGKAMGLRLIAAASSPAKLEHCRAHGADALIDYRAEDLRAALRREAGEGGRGPDLIVDSIGGELAEAAFRSIARGGRHLVIGFASGSIPTLSLNLPLLKAASVVGVWWGDCLRHRNAAAREQVQALMAAVAAGRIVPAISERITLGDAPGAIARLLAGEGAGKIVAIVD